MSGFDRNPLLTKALRHEIVKNIWQFAQIMSRTAVVTFHESAITITLFPHSGTSFNIPAGPHTHTIRDGVVEDS